MENIRVFRVSSGHITLKACAVKMGRDLCVSVTGGDSPHIGSCSVSIARPSMLDEKKTSSTTSTINITGHKDDAVGNKISSRLSAQLNVNVAVICGIHIDDISQEAIGEVLSLADELTEKILKELTAPV
ncbi:MAG: hypothetical protein GX254_06340 [Clostridiales bacterium]|jgi:hypothetical protein|nr:hypothetical protein [Clostridiales bacterium]